jgi:hypothetical protein
MKKRYQVSKIDIVVVEHPRQINSHRCVGLRRVNILDYMLARAAWHKITTQCEECVSMWASMTQI